MKINKLIIVAMLMVVSTFGIKAQMSMSPYSKYGYGLLNDNATSAQRAMGGVGYAMNSGRQINVMNPASYAAIDSLTFLFDIGVDFTSLWSEENGATGKDFGGGLDYVTMQFPTTKYLGASVGLLPFSSVGYSFGQEISHGTNSREGSGGINQVYLGLSGKPFKGFTLGANVSYLFGTIINDAYAYTSEGSTTLFERVMKVKDYRLQFGVQYSLNLNKNDRVTIGAVYTPGKTLLGDTWGISYDVSSDLKADTIGFTSLKDKYTMPETWGVGINYEWDEKLMAEVDFTYQPWREAKFSALEDFETVKFDNRWKIAAGLQYTPKVRGSYWQRINYRVGGFFNHDYIMVGDNNVREYGVSAGFGLPVNRLKTVVNIGFEYKHRQAHPNPMVKEDYFNITLGVNFNEMWFWRNKIR